MKFYLLQSGSAGNSCLIVSKETKILIDVGISLKSLKSKLESLNYSLSDIDAVLITHEHSDHILSAKYLDVKKIYATKETFDFYGYHEIIPYEQFKIKDLNIRPISISHDIRNGVGYIIEEDDEKLVYLTDTGKVLSVNIPLMKDANYYVIESNHNVQMLEQTNRPLYLIKRILSNKGHLSNEQSGKAMSKCIGPKTNIIVLAHLSNEANTKQLALAEFKAQLNFKKIDYSKIKIIAVDRFDITIGKNE